jgi:hypothetical protein
MVKEAACLPQAGYKVLAIKRPTLYLSILFWVGTAHSLASRSIFFAPEGLSLGSELQDR